MLLLYTSSAFCDDNLQCIVKVGWGELLPRLTQASLEEIVGEMRDQIVNSVELRIQNFIQSELAA